MTEQEAIAILENRDTDLFYLIENNAGPKDLAEYEVLKIAMDVALIALRRGDTLAISHGWTKENIEQASLSVTTSTKGPCQIYDMKEGRWLKDGESLP